MADRHPATPRVSTGGALPLALLLLALLLLSAFVWQSSRPRQSSSAHASPPVPNHDPVSATGPDPGLERSSGGCPHDDVFADDDEWDPWEAGDEGEWWEEEYYEWDDLWEDDDEAEGWEEEYDEWW